MCGPIPRRRTPLAAYSEEHRCLLIANYLRIARPAVGSGGPGLATSITGQSGAENTFALSVARLVESLPLSTPPGRNVAHFTRPDHRSGFRPASVGVGERVADRPSGSKGERSENSSFFPLSRRFEKPKAMI
jgi:hypothetical protein